MLKEKLESNLLEYNIVLMFDRQTSISQEQYQDLIELCKDRKIYIVNINDQELSFESDNIKVIDFYNQINKNKDYLEFDNIHLSDIGISSLIEELSNSIKDM